MERLMRCRHGGKGVCLDGHVTAVSDCASPSGLDKPRRFFDPRRVNIAARDRRSSLGKGESDRPTDTTARTAHEGGPAGQRHRMLPLMVRASPCRHRSRWFGR